MSGTPSDTEQASLDLIAKMDAAIAEAEQQLAEGRRVMDKHGIPKGIGRKYLESDQVPAEEREKALAELAALNDEIEQDVRAAAAAANPAKPAAKPKMGMMRV